MRYDDEGRETKPLIDEHTIKKFVKSCGKNSISQRKMLGEESCGSRERQLRHTFSRRSNNCYILF